VGHATIRDVSKLDELEERMAAIQERIRAGFGERARELRAAAQRLEQGDEAARDEVRRLAHKLRGIAGSAGCAALGERAAKMETAARNEALPAHAIIACAKHLADAVARANADATAEPAAPPERNAAPARPQLGWRVVAIDDEPSTRRLIEITLNTAGGCDAMVVASADEAMRSIIGRPPDLVIVDAMMPDVDGLTFYRGVRRSVGGEVPVVILSAASAEELGWTLPEDERLRWMRKPFRPASLLAELRAFVTPDGAH
jgi:CheY-like chemotaxis protein/HPt (histidine-containing phosphotransfer) domain-containing protein